MIDLALLPMPRVIEELDFEAIVTRQKATFQSLWEAVRLTNPDLPDYDVSMLETDPVTVIIEAESYRELLMRARANDAARSNLLAFATGADLDHLAADHGVTRLEAETDARLRQRIVLADQGRSSAGSEEWYAYHAMSVSTDVAEVAVYRSGLGPELEVAILSSEDGGVPSSALLGAVATVVTGAGVRCVSDVVEVVAATSQVIDVSADIWLLPETPRAVFDGLESALRQALTSEGGIGFDINRSWLAARLMVGGVARVEILEPAMDIVAEDHQAIALGAVTLHYRGRAR
ncbi:baseplate assembly protein [Rhizobium halophytocola]|uniref:Phage-related baseplate assembly protein n=1 Tax=Rhizobium halophytocola TaxID=735519 RepID=A0ABS4E2E7_9HYPH|nr:baseplate J/gp47 family protein [Rhizobium halophytocola]MBP1852117.1 phage-related baseplate assembly protein [Rhizobium halophytocola]